MQRIFQDILEKNKPKKEDYEKIMTKVEKVIDHLQEKLEGKADVMLGGSAAKGTIIKGDFDCDVFARFDARFKAGPISDILEIALGKFKADRIHGSRDYFRAKIAGIQYEFIPVLKIASPADAENVTDSSPLHVAWIKTKIRKNPKLVDEIMLAKLFCKAQKVYGAESYIGGFSGHVLDILTVHYGSFKELLKNATLWKEGDVIDIENHGSASSLNSAKLSPLIVLDPIAHDRNAAAALSLGKFRLFIRQAKMFLEKPSEEFFMKKKVTISSLKKKTDGNSLYLVDVEPEEGKVDVVGSKILKIYIHIERQLKDNDFTLIDSGWEWDKKGNAMLWYLVKKETLPEKKLSAGPPLREGKDIERFKAKHDEVFERDGRLYAYIKRRFTDPEHLIKALLDCPYVKERAKSTKNHKY